VILIIYFPEIVFVVFRFPCAVRCAVRMFYDVFVVVVVFCRSTTLHKHRGKCARKRKWAKETRRKVDDGKGGGGEYTVPR